MELNYNVKGDRRKQLVKALEDILGTKSVYMRTNICLSYRWGYCRQGWNDHQRRQINRGV